MELFVLDRNTWNLTTQTKLLVLDIVDVTVDKKNSKQQSLKNENINVHWMQFPNFLV